MFRAHSNPLAPFAAGKRAYLPRALLVTLGLLFALYLVTASGARLEPLLEKLADQRQLFFRLLFASRTLSLDMARAMARRLYGRSRVLENLGSRRRGEPSRFIRMAGSPSYSRSAREPRLVGWPRPPAPPDANGHPAARLGAGGSSLPRPGSAITGRRRGCSAG
jgi:hypothetical protein